MKAFDFYIGLSILIYCLGEGDMALIGWVVCLILAMFHAILRRIRNE